MILKYSTTNREEYKEYKSNPSDCIKCSNKSKCTESKNSIKVVTIHVWEKYIEEVEDIRHSIGMKEIYSLRSQTIERTFADTKELHGMRYTQYRGLAKVKMKLTLKFVCMNLKKLAIWKARNGFFAHNNSLILINIRFFIKKRYQKYFLIPLRLQSEKLSKRVFFANYVLKLHKIK